MPSRTAEVAAAANLLRQHGSCRAWVPPWNMGVTPTQVHWCNEVREYRRANCGTQATWKAECALQAAWCAEIRFMRAVVTPGEADAAAAAVLHASPEPQCAYFVLGAELRALPPLKAVEARVLETLCQPRARVASAYALVQSRSGDRSHRAGPTPVNRMHPGPQRDHHGGITCILPCSHHSVLLRHTGLRTGVWGAGPGKGQLLRFPRAAGGAISCPAGALHCPALPDEGDYEAIKIVYLVWADYL